MRLDGKTAVVTGGASGIGRAVATTLAQAGAQVLIGDINQSGGEAAAAELRAAGHGVRFARLDVTDLDSIAAFRDQAQAGGGKVDVIAHVAGWGKVEPFLQNVPEFWRKVIDLNSTARWH